jgi:hypothetical protein
MEVSGQLHATSSLPPGKQSPIPIRYGIELLTVSLKKPQIPFKFRDKNFVSSQCVMRARPSHPPPLDYPNIISRIVQIMNLLIRGLQFYPFFCVLRPEFRHSSQRPVHNFNLDSFVFLLMFWMPLILCMYTYPFFRFRPTRFLHRLKVDHKRQHTTLCPAIYNLVQETMATSAFESISALLWRVNTRYKNAPWWKHHQYIRFSDASPLLNNYFTYPDIEVWNFRGRAQWSHRPRPFKHWRRQYEFLSGRRYLSVSLYAVSSFGWLDSIWGIQPLPLIKV